MMRLGIQSYRPLQLIMSCVKICQESPKTEQAELVGQTIAKRAKSLGVEQVVFDRAGYRYIGRVKALADGAREGGLQF